MIDPQGTRSLVPVDSAPVQVPAVTGQAVDAISDLKEAWRTVEGIRGHDISVQPQATAVCAGLSQLEALQAVVAMLQQSPRAVLNDIAWARTPGPVVGTWQFQATLYLSYPDALGETTGVTHHAAGPSGTA